MSGAGMNAEKSKERIVKALIEHSRKQGKPLTEMEIVSGINALYSRMGEASIHRYRGNVTLLAEDIRSALKAQGRVGGLRPILVRGELKLVPAGRRVLAPVKAMPVLLKKKAALKRLI